MYCSATADSCTVSLQLLFSKAIAVDCVLWPLSKHSGWWIKKYCSSLAAIPFADFCCLLLSFSLSPCIVSCDCYSTTVANGIKFRAISQKLDCYWLYHVVIVNMAITIPIKSPFGAAIKLPTILQFLLQFVQPSVPPLRDYQL